MTVLPYFSVLLLFNSQPCKGTLAAVGYSHVLDLKLSRTCCACQFTAQHNIEALALLHTLLSLLICCYDSAVIH